MAVIGIDIGTTSICALRMEQGQVQEVKKQSHGFLDARLYTQDPEEILATVRRLTEALWSSQVTDIAISAQMHGILFTDARGRAVTPFYTWKNPWGHQAMEGRTVARYLARQTGGRVAPVSRAPVEPAETKASPLPSARSFSPNTMEEFFRL